METNQKKLEGDFTFISSAILDEALEYTGHSYCDISFEISTNMYVESEVDVVDKNNKSVGGVTDYWGSSEIYVIKTQELYRILGVSNSKELLDLLYEVDGNDNIDRKDINPGGNCPFVFELPDFKGKIRSFEYDEDEMDDMCDVSIKISEIIGINTKTNDKVHLALTVF